MILDLCKSTYRSAFVVMTSSFVAGITLALADAGVGVPAPIIGGYVVFNHLIPDQTFWTTIVGLIGAGIMGASKTVEAIIAWRKHRAEMRELELREQQLEMDRFALTTLGDRRIKYKRVAQDRRNYGTPKTDLAVGDGDDTGAPGG